MYDLILDRYADPKSQPFGEALLAAARLRDELEQDRQATDLYERLVKAYPKHAELDAVLYEWSWVLRDLGRDDEAATRLKRIHQEFPKSEYWADATYRLAQRALDAKDHATANALADAILAKGPKADIGEHALCLKWQIAAVDKKWDDVRRAAERLVKDYPESRLRLVADFWIAEALYRQADYDAAGERFAKLMRRRRGRDEPWTAMIPLRRAQVLAQKKKWIEAQAVASKIEAEYPEFEQQYEVDCVLGRCLASRADFQAAREAYRNVIRSKRGAKNRNRRHGPMDDRRDLLPPGELRGRVAGIPAGGNPLCVSPLASRRVVAGGQMSRAIGRMEGSRRVVRPTRENLSQNTVRRSGQPPIARRRGGVRIPSKCPSIRR